MSRCFVARRVSTDEQSLGLEAQLHDCEVWAKAHNMEIAGVFDDEDVCGAASLDKRPGMLAAIAEIGKGDILLVSKRDRLGREPMVLAMIEREVQRKGGRIVSAAGEGTESDNPDNVFFRRIIDAYGERERLVIKARTKAALAAKRRRGEKLGGRIPYGYVLADDGKLIANPREQEGINRMYELREQGLSLRKIGERLQNEGFPSKTGSPWKAETIKQILARSQSVQVAC